MAETDVPNRGPQIKAAAYTMLILATIAVALRFWSRHISQKAGFWWDDWFALIALPFVWANSAVTIYWVHIGLGKHIKQAPNPPTDDAKVLFAANLIYNTGLSLVKMSVLLLYVRIFKTVKLYRLAFWFVGFLIVGWFLAINFLAIFACIPVQKSWDPEMKGHCIPLHAGFLGTTASNIIIDGFILLLPMPMLWRLHIDVRHKLGLIAVFAAGYCVIILSVLRLVSILDQGNSLQKDITWNNVFAQILVTCEVPVALISSSLPSIFNLAKHGVRSYFPRLYVASGGSHSLGGPGGKNIGPVGNPIDDRKENGFVQLRSDQFDIMDSTERLYEGHNGVSHPTITSPASFSRGQGEAHPEMGIPLHQIHVRDDVDIDSRRST